MKKSLIMIIIIAVITSITIPIGLSYGLVHVDYTDPDWGCKKWIGLVELAKQDYPHFVDHTLFMAEMKCGFDVDELTS